MLIEAKKRKDLHLFIYDDVVELLAEGTRKEVCEKPTCARSDSLISLNEGLASGFSSIQLLKTSQK